MTTTVLTLTDRRELAVLTERRALQLAMADGVGRVGVQDARTGEWRWIALDEIVEIGERPLP
jgi:hypothetical protein